MNRIFRTAKFSLFLFFALAFSASAYYNPGNPTGFVNDYAGMLSAEQKQTLENKLSQFEKDSSNEISVVTIQNLQGDTIENFAVELFKQWGIGKKGKDNGVLVLVALQDRKMRIEVGYGLEGTLTDAQSSWIINDIMKPAFRENNYYKGIDGAVDKIIYSLNGGVIPTNSNTQKSSSEEKKPADDFFQIIIWFLVAFGIGFLQSKKKWVFGIIAWMPLLALTYYLHTHKIVSDGIMFLYYALSILYFIAIIIVVLGRSRSWWIGGLGGGLLGATISYFSNWSGVWWWIVILSILGLIVDFLVSFRGKNKKGEQFKNPWWMKGGSSGGSSGGGFGGFGGGGSGGGGSSGSW